MADNSMSLTSALSKHLRLTDESPSQCLAELKKLNQDDKQWFATQFKKEMNIDVTFTS